MVYAMLSESEHKHFDDLYKGAGHFKLSSDASPAEKRKRTIDALASVLPADNVREVIGADEVTVMHRGDLTERWKRV